MCDLNCSICFDNLLLDVDLTILHCGHLFHQKCLTELLKHNQKCPNCRQKIEFIKLPAQLFKPATAIVSEMVQVDYLPSPKPQQDLLMRDLLNKAKQIEEMALEIEQLQYQIDDHEESVTNEEFEHLQARCTILTTQNETLKIGQIGLLEDIRKMEEKVDLRG